MSDLNTRIDIAIHRITNGMGNMRVPAESTDPDLVLADCRERIAALESQLAEARMVIEKADEFLSHLDPSHWLWKEVGPLRGAIEEYRGASKDGLWIPVATESAPEGASVDPATQFQPRYIETLKSLGFDERFLEEYGKQKMKIREQATQLAAANAKVERLEGWKESALKVLNSLPSQEIGNEIGVQWGDSVSDKILPAIRQLKQRNERLEKFVQAVRAASTVELPRPGIIRALRTLDDKE